MTKVQLEYCQEMKERLKKYDIVGEWENSEKSRKQKIDINLNEQKTGIKSKEKKSYAIPDKLKKDCENIFGINWEDSAEEIEKFYKEKENDTNRAFLLWKKLLRRLSEPREMNFQLLEALSGRIDNNRFEIGIPRKIREIYSDVLKDVNNFLSGSNWIYEKDLWRALAYHIYISEFKIDDKIKYQNAPLYEKKEYLNIPINTQFEYKKQSFYIYPNIGGGILNKIYLDKKFGEVFLKNQKAFDDEGRYTGKEKGTNFITLRQGLENTLSGHVGAADAWFLKNVFDPEFLVDIYETLKDSKSINFNDYTLIWIFCHCSCPTVRLLLWEAFKPCYIYIRNYLKNDIGIMDFFFEEVKRIIREVNNKFWCMENFTAFFFDKYKISGDEIEKMIPDLKESFEKGDDFPFFYKDKQEDKHDERSMETYIDYLPSGSGVGNQKEDLCIKKVTYAVMSALQEIWTDKREQTQKDIKICDNVFELQQSYQGRLFKHYLNRSRKLYKTTSG